jgi:hypothetical protein
MIGLIKQSTCVDLSIKYYKLENADWKQVIHTQRKAFCAQLTELFYQKLLIHRVFNLSYYFNLTFNKKNKNRNGKPLLCHSNSDTEK